MGQSDIHADEGIKIRLLETARAMVLRGDNQFSVESVCTEAGVERSDFHAHFSGKTALMAELMQAPVVATAVPQAPDAPAAERTAESVCEPNSKADETPGPSVSTPDAWLERRLRVFERALNALEAKAETAAREHARAIAQLEERLGAAPVTPTPVIIPASTPAPVEPKQDVWPQPAPQVHRVELASVKQEEVPPAEDVEIKPALLAIPPAAVITSKEELAGMLQNAREKARAASVEPEPPPPSNSKRTRWLAMGALSLVVLFLCIGLSLGRNAFGGSASAQESDGVTHRHLAATKLGQTIALADAGNTRAQARLALAYLRGQGSAGGANAALLWTQSAARAGNPVAQYLMGAMFQQGNHVMVDPVVAFAWFSRAAEKGNLKAMHNLAIAYAPGLGTAKDEAKAAGWFTRAAEHGYVDSAFDLAVLYERGAGVKQDLVQALKWYDIASLAGDAPSQGRADFLRGQMKAADIRLAHNAAMAFAPLPALDEANSL